jgi:NAD(P)H-quinone oxidoreductase subunit 5
MNFTEDTFVGTVRASRPVGSTLLNLQAITWTNPEAAQTVLFAAPLLLYGLAAIGSRWVSPLLWAWRLARAASLTALVAASCSLFWVALNGPVTLAGWSLLSLGHWGELRLSFRLDAITSTVLLLVSFLGWVIVRYSQTYLAGEPQQARYVSGLMLTLAAVSGVVVSNNLGVLVLAWIATSLALNALLTFFADRPQALLVAHKKALASRVAEFCLLVAVALVGASTGSLEIDQLLAQVAALSQTDRGLPLALHVAAVLFAIAAVLKCAQLPVHGWLIQVMEAPTPVSALLHAGVVNLGGLVLIRLGALVAEVPAAQTLLVVVGSTTAVVAALVMMTRISVKVMLAWSTCAQMGFMLMQCGLGAYSLALLHLLAHSLYKAHAFLAAGTAVEQARLQRLTPARAAPGALATVVATLASLAVVLLAAGLWNSVAAPIIGATGSERINVTTLVLTGIFCLALTPWFNAQAGRFSGAAVLVCSVLTLLLTLLYFALNGALNGWMGGPPLATPSPMLLTWVAASFVLLFLVQNVIRARPQGAFAQKLYPWFFAGLHLDEWFTRLALRVWPLRLAPEVTISPDPAVPQTTSGVL